MRAISVSTIVLATMIAGCQTGPEESTPAGEVAVAEQAVSECGGFAEVRELAPDGDYCSAEQLRWSYEAGTLQLTDSRAVLNCCGERTIDVQVEDGVLVVTETDAPEGEGGRCFCTCVFDLSVTLTGVAEGPTAVRLVRDVTDEAGGPRVLFEGDLDLAAGEGAEVLTTDPAPPDCDAATSEEIAVEESLVSECGGFPIDDSPDWGDDDYCDAELLTYAFDADDGTVEIGNQRVVANCCGDRSIGAELVDGVLVVTETDAPESGSGRCWCECVYDFAITVSGVSGSSIPARLVRDVTDGAGPVVIWEGDLDLAAGSGSVVTSTEDATGACESL